MKIKRVITVLVCIGFVAYLIDRSTTPTVDSLDTAGTSVAGDSSAVLVGLNVPGSEPESMDESSMDFQVVQFLDVQEIEPNATLGSHDHIIKQWRGKIDPSISSLAQRMLNEDTFKGIQLHFPEELSLHVSLKKHTAFSENRGVIQGEVVGSGSSEVYLSYVNQSVSGTIVNPEQNEIIEIRNAGDGYQYIALLDSNKLGGCAACALAINGR